MFPTSLLAVLSAGVCSPVRACVCARPTVPEVVIPALPEFAAEMAVVQDAQGGPPRRRMAQFLVMDYHPHTLRAVRSRLPTPLPLKLFVQYAIDLLSVCAAHCCGQCVCAVLCLCSALLSSPLLSAPLCSPPLRLSAVPCCVITAVMTPSLLPVTRALHRGWYCPVRCCAVLCRAVCHNTRLPCTWKSTQRATST